MSHKTNTIIAKAKYFLQKHNYDAAHDVNHHENVWKIAQEISKNIDTPVNVDLLHIACLWHDVLTKPYTPDEVKEHERITKETAEYVKDFMLKNGFIESDAQTVYLAVRHHEFHDKPVNTEGRVLFDADKLDNLRVERFRRFVQQDKAGNIPRWKINAYKKGADMFSKYLRSKLQFAYSRQFFDARAEKILEDKEIQEYAKRYDIDLEKIKRNLRRRTFIDRVMAFFSR